MKLTKVKKGMVVGALSLGLVAGAGGVLANTDAGQQLQNWYDAKFGAATAQSTNDVKSYATTEAGKAASVGLGWLNTAKGNVTKAGEDEVTSANGEINAALNQHINAINSTEGSIKSGMDAQFSGHVDTVTGYINDEVKRYSGIATNYINGQMNAAGTAAVTKVDTEVTATKNSAIAALEQEINETKAEIERLLGEKASAATDTLKRYIDSEVTRLKAQYKKLIDDLEVAKKQDISDKGAEIVQDAKDDLDALVGGINQ